MAIAASSRTRFRIAEQPAQKIERMNAFVDQQRVASGLPSALPSGNNRRGDYRHNERESRALHGVQISQPEKQRPQDERH
jgi:hypothetical protein